MSGIPKFNFPAFYAAAKDLRSVGYEIVSPAELDDADHAGEALRSASGAPGDSTTTWGKCLGRDVQLIADECSGIVFLPAWEGSRGARLEAFTGFVVGLEFGLYTPEIPRRITEVTGNYIIRRLF